MNFLPLTESFLQQAETLAREQYNRERSACPGLPADMPQYPMGRTLKDAEEGVGFAAVTDDGTAAGYLFFPWIKLNGFFGNCTGAYSPLHCYAVRDSSSLKGGMTRGKTVSLLFQKCAESLMQKACSSLAMTVYAHDAEVVDVLSLNGLGIRCADAIRETAVPLNDAGSPEKYTLPADFSFAAIESDRLTADSVLTARFTGLFTILVNHLRASPVFFAEEPWTAAAFALRCEKRRSRFFTVFTENGNGREPVGYIELYSGGENFVSGGLAESNSLQHICGAVVRPEYRGIIPGGSTTIAEFILEQIRRTMTTEGISLLGVDCETLNPTARYFWSKYFTNYTCSMHRRIDERLLQ
jgi:hypothetical protein